MSGFIFKQKGDILTHQEWNDLVAYALRQPHNAGKTEIVVYNNSGGALPIYSILGVDSLHDGYTPTPSESLPLFIDPSNIVIDGITPTLADHANKFVVIQESAENDQPVPCLAFGLVKVLLDVTDEDHKYAQITDNDCTHMESSVSGYPIYWKDTEGNEDENGYRWSVVLLGGGGGSTTTSDYEVAILRQTLLFEGTVEAWCMEWSDAEQKHFLPPLNDRRTILVRSGQLSAAVYVAGLRVRAVQDPDGNYSILVSDCRYQEI